MNVLVQLGDLVIDDKKLKFNPFKLNASDVSFPGMGITYLDSENTSILLLPEGISVLLKTVLINFAMFYYCKDDRGTRFDRNLLIETLEHTRDFVNVMYTLDSIYKNDQEEWDINSDLENVFSIGNTEELEEVLNDVLNEVLEEAIEDMEAETSEEEK